MLRRIDNRFDYGEDRWAAEETINITFIRKATKNERKTYEKYITNRLG